VVAVPPLVVEMRSIDALLRSGQLDAAHTRLAAIVASHPTFVEAQRLLAGTKLAMGEAEAAEVLLRRALDIDPHWTPTLTSLGEMLLSSGRGDEGELTLQRAVTGSRPDPRAARMLARYYNETGRPAAALATASAFLTRESTDAEIAAQHAAALIALGRHAEAIGTYSDLLKTAPDNQALAHALAMVLNATERHSEAVHVTRRVLARGVKSGAINYSYARSLMATGDASGAEAALRQCLDLEPRRIEAHISLAQLVWARTGDLAQATETLVQALRHFPNDDALWAAKAAIHLGADDARGAYASLASRVERAQVSPMLLLRAGLAALEFEPATALSLAERALRVLPANAAARTLRAAARLGVGDARGALQDCEDLHSSNAVDQYVIALETTAMRLLGDARYDALCDYRNLILSFTLEPPPPWQTLAAFLSDIKGSLDCLHDPRGHALLFKSLRGGTETTAELSRNPEPGIRALFAAFARPIERYLEHIGRGTDPLRRRNTGRWRLSGSWSVRLRDRGYHRTHTHPKGWISSSCYIELPDHIANIHTDEGILQFGKPGVLTQPALDADYSIRPAVGMLVLFPSYFWHGTVPFQGSQPRLTVAFDVVPE